VTLSALVRKVLGLPSDSVRIDTKARLIGYVLLVRYGGGWNGLNISPVSISRIKKALTQHGVNVDDLDT
jgi:hypothetical protein